MKKTCFFFFFSVKVAVAIWGQICNKLHCVSVGVGCEFDRTGGRAYYHTVVINFNKTLFRRKLNEQIQSIT